MRSDTVARWVVWVMLAAGIPAHGATPATQRGVLLPLQGTEVTAHLEAPSVVFRDEPVVVPLEVRNAGDRPLQGDLVMQVGERQDTVAAGWTLAAAGQWRHRWQFAPSSPGEVLVQLVLRGSQGQRTTLAQTQIKVLDERQAAPAQNVLRNASFELPLYFNADTMRRPAEIPYLTARRNGQRLWTELPIEGWWAQGPDGTGISVDPHTRHSGQQSVCLAAGDRPVALVSAPGRWLPAGDVTLSAWVKGQQAKGQLQLDLVDADGQILSQGAEVRRTAELPPNSDWTRLVITTHIGRPMEAIARIRVTSGRVWVDDVQAQAAPAPTAFNLRPAEWIRLNLPQVPADELPKWVAGDKTPHLLTVQCDSDAPLSGYVTLALGSWDRPGTHRIGRVEAAQLRDGHVVKIQFTTSTLPADAYVITADYHPDDQTAWLGAAQFRPLTLSGGSASSSMLRSHQAIRLAIIPDYQPARLFGVGNGMLDTSGDWYQGYNIRDYQWAGKLGYICDRGRYNQDKGYLIAAGAMPTHRMESLRADADATHNVAIDNPARPGVLDLCNPLGHAQFLRQARAIGLQNGGNPQIASYQMSNEQPFYSQDGICPTQDADAAFRQWCRDRYGRLATLNRHWGTTYTSWDQVDQPLSARTLDTIRRGKKLTGAAAVAWTAVYGHMNQQANAIIQSIPGRGLDWYRWRTARSLQMYREFRQEARTVDKKTLYSTNLCWPNFWPQMAMPFFRAMDVTMLDLEYSAGQGGSLGTPSEMMEMLEMFESNAPDKPLWGIEVYTQPQWPAAATALQNWAMIAHGVSNILLFGWRPYADAGRVVGTHAWERPKAPPMWCILDNDGTELPSFHAAEKSLREIQDFNRKFDGLSIKRYPATIAVYLSDDSSEYLSYLTGNKPYATSLTTSRNTLLYLMRMAGLQVDYLDDQLLAEKLPQYRTLILPPTPLLSDEAAQRIAAFVQGGGQLVLVGAAGQYDPWLHPRTPLGGEAWAALDWRAPDYDNHAVAPASHFLGRNIGQLAGGQPIVDEQGQTLGWTKAWGQGHVVALGVYPTVYVQNPHMPADASQWMNVMIAQAHLPITARWVPENRPRPETSDSYGQGDPDVEVVLRKKSDDMIFAFVLNQGGAGAGMVDCHIPVSSSHPWHVSDVLTGQMLQTRQTADGVQTSLKLPAWGYRVLQFAR